MVEVIVEEIGKQVKAKNTYFDSYAVNAIQMPNGEVLVNLYGEEPESKTISDCQGIAFYIRIEPKARVSRSSRQFTSESPHRFTARQTCHLVAFAFEHPKEIDSQKWVDALAATLLAVDISSMQSKPSIEITDQNASHVENFLEETKKQFNVQKKFNCVKVSFDLLYDIRPEDCNFCDIFREDCPA